MTMFVESSEDRARAAKAMRIVRYLASRNFADVAYVRDLDRSDRDAICVVAGVSEASDRTWSTVVGILVALGDAALVEARKV